MNLLLFPGRAARDRGALPRLGGRGPRLAGGLRLADRARDIAPDMPGAERRDYGEVVLAQRLRDALARLNPAMPAEALEDAFRTSSRGRKGPS